MSLQMKPGCERCATTLGMQDEVWICSYECTWCADCARTMAYVCPNCGGELVRRPRRRPRLEGD